MERRTVADLKVLQHPDVLESLSAATSVELDSERELFAIHIDCSNMDPSGDVLLDEDGNSSSSSCDDGLTLFQRGGAISDKKSSTPLKPHKDLAWDDDAVLDCFALFRKLPWEESSYICQLDAKDSTRTSSSRSDPPLHQQKGSRLVPT